MELWTNVSTVSQNKDLSKITNSEIMTVVIKKKSRNRHKQPFNYFLGHMIIRPDTIH